MTNVRQSHMVHHGAYHPIGADASTCFYCGQPATCMDHFPPVSQYVHGSDSWLVPSCSECNSLAGDSIQYTLEQRRAYVREKLSKRYRKLLNMPEWSDEELNELGESLRESVVRALHEKHHIESRISWENGSEGSF